MDYSKGTITKNRVLNSALKIVNTSGYHNTSINDIIAATGVKKGNLYFHFQSKDDLIASIIGKAREEYFKYLAENIRGEKPSEKIVSILRAVFNYHKKTGFIGGCIFGNLSLEIADDNARLSAVLYDIFSEWIGFMARLLDDAKESGEIKPDIDTAATAKQIVACLEGGIMMSKLTKDERDLKECINSQLVLLGIKHGEEHDF
ncbi:MAG: TetR/AcrR family transcriptional regulator [Spirochaetes bacterium]|jgi:TetR/AcrR family transcriptional repressor of nem operon|nr:TetR/AcrR family transcriptional regulator [Spirochaetota bacterium]